MDEFEESKYGKRIYIGILGFGTIDNVEYAVLTDEEIKEALEEHETIYDYLTDKPHDSWTEIPVTEGNLKAIEEIGRAMKEILRKKKRK